MSKEDEEYMRLWFDVESRYKATSIRNITGKQGLWFDVESRYKATVRKVYRSAYELWFDVESRCKATCKVPAEFTVML